MRARAAVVACLKAANPSRFLNLLLGRGSAIRTYTSAEELIFLYDEATKCVRTGIVVEIGSHLGASSVVLAEALRRVAARRMLTKPQLYCIDTWRNDAMTEGAKDTFDEFQFNTMPWTSYIVPVRGYSGEVSLPFSEECDLVFIDGDHSYEAVRTDIDRFSTRVQIGGRVVFHDQDRPGVIRAVGELLLTGRWRISGAVSGMLSLERIA